MVGDNLSGLTAELVVSRSVRDTAAILEAVHGPAPGDPYVAPPPARPYTEELGADPGQLRVALSTEPLTDHEADPVVVEAARGAAELLESLGHTVEEPDLGAVEGDGPDRRLPRPLGRGSGGDARPDRLDRRAAGSAPATSSP